MDLARYTFDLSASLDRRGCGCVEFSTYARTEEEARAILASRIPGTVARLRSPAPVRVTDPVWRPVCLTSACLWEGWRVTLRQDVTGAIRRAILPGGGTARPARQYTTAELDTLEAWP